jgi:hypothetical protein
VCMTYLMQNRVGEGRVLDSLFFGDWEEEGGDKMVLGCETSKCARTTYLMHIATIKIMFIITSKRKHDRHKYKKVNHNV